ncbi:uncharacterized protein QC764_708580 [Podospora pseudoanserina]|uniref:Wings apart-like protein C-terminal domain-containing protein n=1 Tax=Podospora pseudoanserina TaxID=2609844 RepID=A0ABR0HKG6_9PEZI|nr:hypothetical protein QC764_708580 [Podospora pseudoanserina]
MDHFNATVKDGKLVNTRRGLQVSRQKFNGISFVNTSAQDSSSSGTQSFRLTKESPSKSTSLLEIKFADTSNELQSAGAATSVQEGQGRTPNFSFVSETGQQHQAKRQPRRRAIPKPKGQQDHRRNSASPYLSSPDSRPPSRSSVATPPPRLEETAFQFFGSSFPTSQRQPQLQQQPFLSPTIQGYHARQQQHLQVNSLTAITSPPLPPPWPPAESATYPVPFSPSQSGWELFHHYNTHHLPLQLYPYEDIVTYNPARSDNNESSIGFSDIAAFHCVLMCGEIAEAVLNRQHHLASESETEPRGFAYHISKICAILNKKLDGNHWDMHMRGLQKVLDVLGGLTSLPTWVVRRIHTADLKGATALASTPYLPLTRSLIPSATTAILPPAQLAHTTHTINSILQPLDIHPSVITTLITLSNFTSAVHLARQSTTSSMRFDPYIFTEELQSVTYDLLTLPNPLSKHSEETPLDITPTLEQALRISSLLLLKDLLPDHPRNLGGYTTLVGLLRHHLQIITQVVSPAHNLLVDPQLRQHHRRKKELRQILTWVCLVGDVATQRAKQNDCRYREAGDNTVLEEDQKEYSREIFQSCLVSIFGPDNNTEDLALVDLFKLGDVICKKGDDLEGVVSLFG